jgi:hypothetical protein
VPDSIGDRLKAAFLKPAPVASPYKKPKPANRRQTIEQLKAQAKSADDKERLVGLLTAPAAAAIGLVISGAMIADHPHQGVYYSVLVVLVLLSVLMLTLAMFRQRLFLGVVMALYGLTVFNLRFWGFGFPFVLVGAWLLVRSYRFQRDLRDATGR